MTRTNVQTNKYNIISRDVIPAMIAAGDTKYFSLYIYNKLHINVFYLLVKVKIICYIKYIGLFSLHYFVIYNSGSNTY